MNMMLKGYKEQKVWDDLKPSEKQRIEDACQRTVYREEDELQDKSMQIDCRVLHDVFGFTEEMLLQFIATHKNHYTKLRQMAKEGNHDDYFAESEKICFPSGGYPHAFVDAMKTK